MCFIGFAYGEVYIEEFAFEVERGSWDRGGFPTPLPSPLQPNPGSVSFVGYPMPPRVAAAWPLRWSVSPISCRLLSSIPTSSDDAGVGSVIAGQGRHPVPAAREAAERVARLDAQDPHRAGRLG